MNCDIPLHLADGKTYLAIFGPFVLVMGLVAYMLYAGKAPTPSKKAALAAVFLVNIGAASFFIWQARSTHVTVGDDSLTLRVGTERVIVPLSALRWDEALDATSIRFPLRKFGTSLPGMHIGWFRKEGGGDAFLLRSSEPSTLVPTSNQFDVVIPTVAYEQVRQCAYSPRTAQ
ncbi:MULTISPECIES: hypothetical protein [Xanthomonas]|uniref:hypothetical protein n=1 Tax=Xanthomonas TaxID=338 RepID=UPI00096CEA23|nr:MULTISPECIES: hypothetical protein [Xanthomonas]MCC5093443.1 PH domain-containing protein [Xanthomonas campestris pv. incanae]MDN0209173.1 hypothetical protein [Xanthomonas arboricola pv. corylina]MDN0213565.1 hypothetical protein [Xanthomonas arboricola pv. corylina]MDV2453512.1 hypothetical protein [Xanthomonas hortorum NBC5720]MEA9482737.1 hypothetical protein [Xanthomonas campestris]